MTIKADGNVLASVLPVLDEHQFAHLFGPALALTFHAPDYPDEHGWPVRRAVHPLTGAQAPPGMLALTPEQIREVEAARLELSRRETMAYLRIHAADETADFDDEGLYREVVAIEKRGYALGLEDMTAHLLFAFMAVTGCASVVESEAFTELAENSGKHRDETISGVFDAMISGAEADVRGTL